MIFILRQKIEMEKIDEIITNDGYIQLIEQTIKNISIINIEEVIKNIIKKLETTLKIEESEEEIFIIFGFHTTTIYSTEYQKKNVTVLLLESTLGLEENIKMLLAHEYTHWIRKKTFCHDIFESCMGERFVTEGIACNFSEKMVPNKKESYYCIVPQKTVNWVNQNMKIIDGLVKESLDSNKGMYNFFYMFAKTIPDNMPVRTGYVYGYLKVKKYLKENNKKVENIIKIGWEDILHK